MVNEPKANIIQNPCSLSLLCTCLVVWFTRSSTCSFVCSYAKLVRWDTNALLLRQPKATHFIVVVFSHLKGLAENAGYPIWGPNWGMYLGTLTKCRPWYYVVHGWVLRIAALQNTLRMQSSFILIIFARAIKIPVETSISSCNTFSLNIISIKMSCHQLFQDF